MDPLGSLYQVSIWQGIPGAGLCHFVREKLSNPKIVRSLKIIGVATLALLGLYRIVPGPTKMHKELVLGDANGLVNLSLWLPASTVATPISVTDVGSVDTRPVRKPTIQDNLESVVAANVKQLQKASDLADSQRYEVFSKALKEGSWQQVETASVGVKDAQLQRKMLNTLVARFIDGLLLSHPATEKDFNIRMDALQSGATRLYFDIQFEERSIFSTDREALQWFYRWREKQLQENGFCGETLLELVRTKLPKKGGYDYLEAIPEVDEAIKLAHHIPQVRDDILTEIAVQAVRHHWSKYQYVTLDYIQDMIKRAIAVRKMMETSIKKGETYDCELWALYDLPTRDALITEEVAMKRKKLNTLSPEVRSRIDDNLLLEIELLANQYPLADCSSFDDAAKIADPVKRDKAIDISIDALTRSRVIQHCATLVKNLHSLYHDPDKRRQPVNEILYGEVETPLPTDTVIIPQQALTSEPANPTISSETLFNCLSNQNDLLTTFDTLLYSQSVKGSKQSIIPAIEEATALAESIPEMRDDLLAGIAVLAAKKDWLKHDCRTLDRIQDPIKRAETIRQMMKVSVMRNHPQNVRLWALYDIPSRNASLTDDLWYYKKKLRTLSSEVRGRLDDNVLVGVEIIKQGPLSNCEALQHVTQYMTDPIKRDQAIDGLLDAMKTFELLKANKEIAERLMQQYHDPDKRRQSVENLF